MHLWICKIKEIRFYWIFKIAKAILQRRELRQSALEDEDKEDSAAEDPEPDPRFDKRAFIFRRAIEAEIANYCWELRGRSSI